MKKIIVLIFVMFLSLPVFAQYKPIPPDLSMQYKVEVEDILDKEVSKAKKEIDKTVKKAKKLHDKLLKNGYNFLDYRNLQLLSEITVWSFGGDIDTKLIKYTQKKYFNYRYKPITIDDFYIYRDYLYQNFEENNVNIEKIKELIRYEESQSKVIEGYIMHIQDTILPQED